MPYKTNNDLPDAVKSDLPKHAQTIYREAFNNALQEYHDEASAYKVAWAAVEKVYKRTDKDEWVKK